MVRTSSRAAACRGCAITFTLLLGGCSVSHLSYHEVAYELNAAVRIDGSGDDRRLYYPEESEVSPWYLRAVLLVPLRPLLLVVFGGRPSPAKHANPSRHVRDLISVLGRKAGGDTQRCADTTLRLLPILELDTSPLNRIAALDALEVMARSLDLELLGDLTLAEMWPTNEALAPELVTTLRDLRPLARPDGAQLTVAEAERYLGALEGLTGRPLGQRNQRTALVQDVLDALGSETAPELVAPTTAALGRALGHCLRWTVIEAVQGQDPQWVDVRLRAVEILHRAGGAGGVATVLALMAASADQIRDGVPRFDPDPFVRMRLIRMCGQLDPQRASVAVRLPGRADSEPVAPVDYLAVLALRPDPYYPGLQVLAQEALSRCLGRPIDYQTDWVREWYIARQRNT